MSNGLGAGFAGLTLFAVLVAIAGVLAVTTAVAFYWRHRQFPVFVRYASVVLVGAVVAVAGFAVLALADEAPPLAALFGAVVWVPLVVAAARARWTGATWPAAVAVAGMAWCLPFLLGTGVLFALAVYTPVSSSVTTVLVGVLTTGGALAVGEFVGGLLSGNGPSRRPRR